MESSDGSTGVDKIPLWFPGVLLIPIPFPLDEVLELLPIEAAIQDTFDLILSVIVYNFGRWGIGFGLF